jgi:hypothetical protein
MVVQASLGDAVFSPRLPGVETPGYYRSSLRDSSPVKPLGLAANIYLRVVANTPSPILHPGSSDIHPEFVVE